MSSLLRPADAREAGAIVRLQSNPDFHALQAILRRALQVSDASNRTLDGPALHRSQGRSLAYVEVLDLERDASKVVAAIKPLPRLTGI